MTVSIASFYPTDVYGGNVACGTFHTKGTYLQFTAATAFAATTVKLTVRSLYANAGTGRYLLDIATGAGGAETVVVANMAIQGGGTSGLDHVLLPLAIGTSVRMACRGQHEAGGAPLIYMVLHILAGDTNAVVTGGTAYTYGAVTATTDGTPVAAGGTAGVKGSYVQMTAATSTPTPVYELVITLRGQSASGEKWHMVDLATGAGGAETIIVPDISMTTSSVIASNNFQKWPVNIVSGTRLAMRALCNDTVAASRTNNYVVIGFAGTLASGGGGGSGTKLYLGSTAVYPA